MKSTSLRDRIAREAARMIDAGRTSDIAEAVNHAMERLGAPRRARPGHGLVRRHLQGMAMQALGEAGYRAVIDRVWTVADQVMTVLAEFDPLLVGRGAKGQFDGGARLHVRAYTDASIGRLAEAVVDAGFEEPTFQTVNTRFGRLNRLTFVEEEIEVVVTRCLPAMAAEAALDLFTRRRIASMRPDEVRHRAGHPTA